MTLKERLQKDFTTHYKAKNQLEVMTLRAINAAIATEEKAGKTAVEFSDDKVEALISREVKKRVASAEIYAEAGETERAEKEKAEAEFLKGYLPEQLSEDELREIVRSVIAENEGANMGLLMKNVMSQVKGKADGRLVKQIVSEEI